MCWYSETNLESCNKQDFQLGLSGAHLKLTSFYKLGEENIGRYFLQWIRDGNLVPTI